MTAEGTACNGAVEAPKAEFAPEKEKVVATSPEEKAVREPEGEDVGGPFVIVNGGDSEGHSDRGSDLGKAPDEDPPSEEDDVPGSNAAPDAPVGGDQGAAEEGEVDASHGALGASSADGGDRGSDGSDGGVDEDEDEPSSDCVADEVAQQEAVSAEDGGRAAPASGGCEPAVTSVDSEAPAVDSEVEGKEGTVDASAIVHVAEAVVHQEASTEQDGDAAVMSSGHDDALTPPKSSSAAMESKFIREDSKEQSTTDVEPQDQGIDGASALVENEHLCADIEADSLVTSTEPDSQEDASMESCSHNDALICTESGSVGIQSEVYGEDSKQEQSNADLVEVMGQGVGSADPLMANGHLCANTQADSSEATTEPENHANESKLTVVAESFEDAAASGEQDATDATSQTDGHIYVALSADSCIVASESKVRSFETVGQETDQQEEEAPKTEAEVLEGVLKPTKSFETVGQETDQQEEEAPKTEAEVSEGVLKPTESFEMDGQKIDQHEEEAPKTEAEVLEGVLKPTERNCAGSVEELTGEEVDIDGHASVEGTADASGEQEAKPMQVEGEATCGILEFEEVDRDSEEGLCDDCVVGVVSSNEETKLLIKERIDEAVPSVDVGESEEVAENTSQDTMQAAVDQVEPVNLNVDELFVADDDQPSLVPSCEHARLDKPGCISKKDDSSEITEDSRSLENESPSPINISDECSSRNANDGSPNEAPHLTEEPCLSDKSCNTINYENGNEPAKSSNVVETKCVEALVTEEKDNGHHASGQWHGDHAQVIIPQKVYIIKVPKFAGDDLWNKIQAVQAHLDQLTQERDVINRRRQKQKAVFDQYKEKLEAARQEEREARVAHGDKKNDLNSVRSVLGKLHQANSVEELDELIAKKERTMQHETISLKEEKLLIKEINELKAQRKQLCATIGSKAELNEAFDQKDHIHERHKVLKKDSDVLFTNLKSLEENTRKIQKSFDDERTALRKLTEEHRAANEIRQKAYSEWTELRNEPSKKNEYFFKYRDARNAAETFRANGDTNGLISHCNSQIERVMEMWNQKEDFRKQYVESNKVSTLRRLGTHDGRRLGPDEDPPVIPSRRPNNIYPLSASSPEVSTLVSIPAPVLAAPAAIPAKEDSFPVLAGPQTCKRAKSKASGSSAQIDNDSVIVPVAEDLKQTSEEKARLLEEQLELARKAEELARKEEELRKERDAAEKERLRLEQKAKAKEAEERKRRKAEKDKERAEFKARKEAEEREKKKAKKDKKKGTTPADSSTIGDSNAAALATADTDSNASDNPREVEVSQPAAPKRLSRPAAAIKQLNRLQPMPAPLRNRGRRKLRQYILIAAAVLSVLALFVAGNYIPRLKSVHS